MVLAVISVFAVCRFDTIRQSFLRKPFSRRNKNFRLLRFFRISADPASGAYRTHSQASGLPKPILLGIPRPIFREKSNGFFYSSVLYYFHIWNPWNLKLSISASCSSHSHGHRCSHGLARLEPPQNRGFSKIPFPKQSKSNL